MRMLAALTVASALLFGTAAHATTGRDADRLIVSALLKSSKVSDKTQPFKTQLGGKPGDKIRPFTASNVRTAFIGMAPAGAFGGAFLHAGGRVSGTINMKTGKVTVKGSMALAKALPPFGR